MPTVASYCNRYQGSRFVIVGKGPTRFEYESLADITDPIIFINDAVQFEKHAASSPETFFFAHDREQQAWLERGMTSTAVVALAGAEDRNGKPMIGVDRLPRKVLDGNTKLVTYEWGGWYGMDVLPRHTREGIAGTQRLMLNSGTIHSAIHFAWLCGASEITFVGCDGWEGYNTSSAKTAYDDRIELATRTGPKGAFGRIRSVQDQMCEALGVRTEYINEASMTPKIPATMHFVWLHVLPGQEMTQWAKGNIDAFRKMHPEWNVRIWNEIPREMPEDLRRIAADTHQLCMRSDIMRYWVLHEYGGMYADCDFVWLRPLDALRRFEAFNWIQHDLRLCNCLMGSVAGGKAMRTILAGVRHAAKEPRPRGKLQHRTHYGPRLLTNLFGRAGANAGKELACLPQHYFGLFIDNKQATAFQQADSAGRQEMIDQRSSKITDPTPPYAVHLWGVGGSSKRATFGRGDALVERIRSHCGDGDVVGAEVGVLAGRLSEHVLKSLPNVTWHMVDRWDASDPEGSYAKSGDDAAKRTRQQMLRDKDHAVERTEFAKDRRQIMHGESVEIAKSIEDESLDVIFFDAGHDLSSVRADLAAWVRKVRPGGLICGHDMDNPDAGPNWATQNPEWGVRRAVEEWMISVGLDPVTDMEIGGETTWFVVKGKP